MTMGGGRDRSAARAGAAADPATPGAWTGGLGRVLLDSLPAMTVIVDERGVVAAANEAWRRFGRENGAGPAVAEGVGQDYFAVCRDGRWRVARGARGRRRASPACSGGSCRSSPSTTPATDPTTRGGSC